MIDLYTLYSFPGSDSSEKEEESEEEVEGNPELLDRIIATGK